jgi:hypothetical protein
MGGISKRLAVVETPKSGDFRVHALLPVTFVMLDPR